MPGQFLLDEIRCGLQKVPEEDFRRFVNFFLNGRRVFVSGAGRSGLVGKCFAMRLMHLGQNVHVLGETTTPALGNGDILLCISASGKTQSVVSAAKNAKKLGVIVLVVTANEAGDLAKHGDFSILIESPCRKEKSDRIIPLGTAFELSSLIYLESVISELMEIVGVDEESMKGRHVNV